MFRHGSTADQARVQLFAIYGEVFTLQTKVEKKKAKHTRPLVLHYFPVADPSIRLQLREAISSSSSHKPTVLVISDRTESKLSCGKHEIQSILSGYKKNIHMHVAAKLAFD
jgi:hypothetical protein